LNFLGTKRAPQRRKFAVRKKQHPTSRNSRGVIKKTYGTKIKNFRLIESRLLDFLFRFEYLFFNLTRNVSSNALVYLKGLFLCRRRNCQVMAEELQESNSQRLHHFITTSRWCYQQVMDVVTLKFWQQLQSLDLTEDSCLIIDEAGNPKKGRHSAGVKRLGYPYDYLYLKRIF